MQEDMKKLIAYSSVAHMGYVTLGIFTLTKQGFDGSMFQMISVVCVCSTFFVCVCVFVTEHIKAHKLLRRNSEFLPKYSLVFMIFVLGALGLPGTTGFIGEFLVLVGIFKKIICCIISYFWCCPSCSLYALVI